MHSARGLQFRIVLLAPFIAADDAVANFVNDGDAGALIRAIPAQSPRRGGS